VLPYIIKGSLTMDRERLKLIYKNLKSLLNALESEIYSDVDSYTKNSTRATIETIFTDDDDGYPD
tara:strand:- start:55 stop:249 length:195 start_codon:yes stop_codon:yes gene_type:complete